MTMLAFTGVDGKRLGLVLGIVVEVDVAQVHVLVLGGKGKRLLVLASLVVDVAWGLRAKADAGRAGLGMFFDTRSLGSKTTG